MRRTIIVLDQSQRKFGAVERGTDGRFISVEIGVAATCDDECCEDSDVGFTVGELNPAHPNGMFWLDRTESTSERRARVLGYDEPDEATQLFELAPRGKGDSRAAMVECLITMAGGDPLEYCLLKEAAVLADKQRRAERRNARQTGIVTEAIRVRRAAQDARAQA